MNIEVLTGEIIEAFKNQHINVKKHNHINVALTLIVFHFGLIFFIKMAILELFILLLHSYVFIISNMNCVSKNIQDQKKKLIELVSFTFKHFISIQIT